MGKNIKEKALADLTEKLSNARNKKEEAQIVYDFAIDAFEKDLKELAHKYFTLAADQNDDYEIKKGAHICLAQYFGETECAKKFFEETAQQFEVKKDEALYYRALFADDLSEKKQCLYRIADKDDYTVWRAYAWNYLAVLFHEQKKEDEAIEYFLKALNQTDSEQMKHMAAYNLGSIFLEKNLEVAKKYLTVAVNQDSDPEIKKAAQKLLVEGEKRNKDIEEKEKEEALARLIEELSRARDKKEEAEIMRIFERSIVSIYGEWILAYKYFFEEFNFEDNEFIKIKISFYFGLFHFWRCHTKEAEKYLTIAVNQDIDYKIKENALAHLIAVKCKANKVEEAEKYIEEFQTMQKEKFNEKADNNTGGKQIKESSR